jgi:hypothetical protein
VSSAFLCPLNCTILSVSLAVGWSVTISASTKAVKTLHGPCVCWCCGHDFRNDAEPGDLFEFTTNKTKNGNPDLKSARKITPAAKISTAPLDPEKFP